MTSLPADPLERRRLQNRQAQRKFRDRRHQRRIQDAQHDQHDQHDQTDAIPFEASSLPQMGDGPLFDAMSSANPLGQFDFFDPSLAMPGLDFSGPLPNNTGDAFHLGSSHGPGPPGIDLGLLPPDNAAQAAYQATRTDPDMGPSQSDTSAAAPRDSGWPYALECCDGDLLKEISMLHIAAFRGHARMMAMLLKQGMRADEPASNGATALHLAAMNNHVDILRLLVKHGADVNARDSLGRPAILGAALHRREEALKYLVAEAGADVNVVSNNKWAAAHVCVYMGWEAGLELLVEFGANLDIPCGKCETWVTKEPGLIELEKRANEPYSGSAA